VLREWQKSDRIEDVKNILVPVDGSNVSNFAAAHAGLIASRIDGNVTLLHVWDKKNEKVLARMKNEKVSISDMKSAICRKVLDDAEDTMMTTGLIDRKVIDGEASEVVVTESNEYDLVVMGTWGRGGIKKFLLGGTAENVAQHAQAPVLLVRGIPD